MSVGAATASESEAVAFPCLEPEDIEALRPLSTSCTFEDGQTIFKAGQADLDLFVVESGAIEIINPSDDNKHVVTHGPRHFAGDIDLLTRRPVIVTAIARGRTRLMRIAGPRLREMLSKVPQVSEKLLLAAQERRRLLEKLGVAGLRVVGPGKCKDTMIVREFLYKNFVPFTWFDSESDEGRKLMAEWGSPKKSPVVEYGGDKRLINPGLRELAQAAGVWRPLPKGDTDLVIIGAGPAGMAAAVYAASEGVNTMVLDRMGPGGQASSSSKIENFIGFPNGLSGAELATRSVLQMLKFGAKLVAPVTVQKIEPATTPDGCHGLVLDGGETMQARTLLIAAGVRWRKLEAEGASQFESAGIHYACTSVEAILYDGRDVAVVGAGNSAGQAVMYLAECCRDRKVHLLVRRKLGPGMSEYLVGRIRAAENVVVHEGVEIGSVQGKQRIESITLRAFRESDESGKGNGKSDGAGQTDGNGKADGDGRRGEEGDGEKLPIAAAFVFIGAEPGCGWLPEAMARDRLGYILTGVDALRSGKWPLKDREPCALETTIPRILAAGDIRAGSTKRVGFAVGDGSMAVTCVHRLIAIRS